MSLAACLINPPDHGLISLPDLATSIAAITTILVILFLPWVIEICCMSQASRTDEQTRPGRAYTSSGKDNMYVSGLQNTGNTCFLNAVLQGLAPLNSLLSYLERTTNALDPPNGVTPIPQSEKPQATLAWILSFFMPTAASPPMPLLYTLKLTLSRLNKPLQSPGVMLPTALISSLESSDQARRLLNMHQQDAQEMLVSMTDMINPPVRVPSLLDAIHHDEGTVYHAQFGSARIEKEDTGLDMPFLSLISSRLECTQCGYMETVRHFANYSISLNLPAEPLTTLGDCLKAYTDEELVEGVTCQKCTQRLAEIAKVRRQERFESASQTMGNLSDARGDLGACAGAVVPLRKRQNTDTVGGLEIDEKVRDVKTKHRKRSLIARSPKILVFHLVRTRFSPWGSVLKHSTLVHFPDLFNLAPYLDGAQPGTAATSDSSSGSSWGATTCAPVLYELKSIICHQGVHAYGHYVCYRRLKGTNKWFRTSDATVRKVRKEEVFDRSLAGQVYLLFYERTGA